MVSSVFGGAANLRAVVRDLACFCCARICCAMCTSEFTLADVFPAVGRSVATACLYRDLPGSGVWSRGDDNCGAAEAGKSGSTIGTGECDMGRDGVLPRDDSGGGADQEPQPQPQPQEQEQGQRQEKEKVKEKVKVKECKLGSGGVEGAGKSKEGVLRQTLRLDGPAADGGHVQRKRGRGDGKSSVLDRNVEFERVRDQCTYTWRRQKGEVFCVLGAFTILIAAVLVVYSRDPARSIALAMVGILATCSCVALIICLCVDYDGSQRLCRTVSPLLFAVPAVTALAPMLSCKLTGSAGCVSIQPRDLLLMIGLPCLLSSAPVMAWQAAFTLSLLIPASFLLLCSWEDYSSGVLPPDHLASVYVTAGFSMLATCPLILLRSRAEKELFAGFEATQAYVGKMVAQQQEAHSAVQHMTKVLDDINRENSDKVSKMRQFISYIFHEIRVPFNAVVLGIGHMLAGNISEEQREILKMMDSSSSSMIRILNDVLDMGKIEAGKLHLEKQPFNMGELVSSIVWSFQDTFDSKGIQFTLSVDDETRERLSSWDVLGDKHRVGQVVANYLSNAAKFTPRGGKVCLRVKCNSLSTQPHSGLTEGAVMDLSNLHSQGECTATEVHEGGPTQVEACTQQAGDRTATIVRVTISVEDTGIGISEEDQKRLFEPYMQVHATSSQAGGGTGLGLCFSKRIVELSGGTIGVHSEVGRGSTFLCTIPLELASPSSTETAAHGNLRHTSRSTFDLSSRFVGGRSMHRCSSGHALTASLEDRIPKVLVVEDNQVNSRILHKLLSSFNVDSETAENGEQALELCRNGARYDMILIDKEMPVMDGHEATRQLRAMGITTPIIGLTGNALESDRNQFLAAGVDDFFTKPLSRHQLVKLLEAYGFMSRSRPSDGHAYKEQRAPLTKSQAPIASCQEAIT